MRKSTATIEQARIVPISMFLVLAMTALVLSACNTTAGIGRDIGAAGGALEESAEDASQ